MADRRMPHRLDDDVDDPVATRYRTPMAAATEPYLKTRRWRRAEQA